MKAKLDDDPRGRPTHLVVENVSQGDHGVACRRWQRDLDLVAKCSPSLSSPCQGPMSTAARCAEYGKRLSPPRHECRPACRA